MPETLKAIYHNGAFILETPDDLPEGTEVEILMKSSHLLLHPISDITEKQRFLKALVERMQQNPIPFNAPSFTREMLHERR
ncbi:MAG TPA: antitoxin family protein [Oscillatoriaceae cyanobacterium M33_DOE_052]|uniref:DUF104 domain-containing protein n=1 Tax=Planktothricoides sp. SpSt-374 TaxID=2282167 RepID=A0A7C3VHM0_9CYAN|nr:antitoxin family protein [Oscillatoriaceae cyanobacterium M33_DOE_052]